MIWNFHRIIRKNFSWREYFDGKNVWCNAWCESQCGWGGVCFAWSEVCSCVLCQEKCGEEQGQCFGGKHQSCGASVPIAGVILGVSHVLASRERSVAPRVWVRSCCQTPAAAVEGAQHRWNQLWWTHQPFPEVFSAAAWWGCQFWGFLRDFLPILKSQPGAEHALGDPGCSSLWFSQVWEVPEIPFRVPVLHSWQELCVHACQGYFE